jgi:endonuclease YncB( thermonuclease family)
MMINRLVAQLLVAILTGCLDASPSTPSASGLSPRATAVRSKTQSLTRNSSEPTGLPYAAVPASTVRNAELVGQVVGVSDGDTITVLDATKRQHKVRLEGIDAPESHQAWGTRAKQELSKKVYLQHVRVVDTGRDKYGRTLGHVYVGPLWVNLDMIASGFAWHYAEYNNEAELASAEVAFVRKHFFWCLFDGRFLVEQAVDRSAQCVEGVSDARYFVTGQH